MPCFLKVLSPSRNRCRVFLIIFSFQDRLRHRRENIQKQLIPDGIPVSSELYGPSGPLTILTPQVSLRVLSVSGRRGSRDGMGEEGVVRVRCGLTLGPVSRHGSWAYGVNGVEL